MNASRVETLPRASRGVVEAIARELVDQPREPRAVLLAAAPVWDGPDSIIVGTNGSAVQVVVRPAATVLAILDHMAAHGDGLLVIPTALTEAELGASLRAQVAFQRIKSIDPWEAIRGNTKAELIDQRLRGRENDWIAEQLLAYGTDLWKRRTTPPRALTRDDVLRRILGIRLAGDPDVVADVAMMLGWSQNPVAVEQWRNLDSALRRHLSTALLEVSGRPAAIVAALADSGEAPDALAVAVAARALTASADRDGIPMARLEQHYFGNDRPEPEALAKFADAGLAYLHRVGGTEATSTYRRAEAILAGFGAEGVIAESDLFTAGFEARLVDFAAAVQAAVAKPEKLSRAEEALVRLSAHSLAGERERQIETARAATRLVRWLAGPEPGEVTVAGWVDWQIREGGWVDSARARLRVADTTGMLRLRRAYEAILLEVRERRALADRRFAARLATWSAGATDRLLLAENLQERIMRPLADAKDREAAPLLIICDGLSAADATTIGADIAADGGWVEVGRHAEGREGALATIPSSTIYSRATLLSGRLACGGQEVERRGLAELWGRRPTRLFHKGDLRAVQAGQVPDALQEALGERGTVVAVVLNTIDDALDKDDLASRPVWSAATVDYLQPLLAAASRASRPVVLCSDHGHIREPANEKNAIAGESARWRTGADAGEGEVSLTGPRVLQGEGVIAAVDEQIRYRSKKAGYHGGASLAEMVIPVQIYVPTAKARAEHWVVYDSAAAHQPAWWSSPVPDAAPPATPKRAKTPAPAADPLFGAPASEKHSIGWQVCETELFQAQVEGVRHAPDPVAVAAIIDAAAAAGGVLAAAQVGRIAGKQPAIVDGYISQLQRALNLDGTQVLTKQDNGASIRLDLELLRQQFLGGRR